MCLLCVLLLVSIFEKCLTKYCSRRHVKTWLSLNQYGTCHNRGRLRSARQKTKVDRQLGIGPPHDFTPNTLRFHRRSSGTIRGKLANRPCCKKRSTRKLHDDIDTHGGLPSTAVVWALRLGVHSRTTIRDQRSRRLPTLLYTVCCD